MTKQIQFFDTTLRDGEQTIGVNFSVDQKKLRLPNSLRIGALM